MRKDIAETLREFLMNGIKPNYSKIAKQFNCDARTVKRYFLNCQNLKRKGSSCIYVGKRANLATHIALSFRKASSLKI